MLHKFTFCCIAEFEMFHIFLIYHCTSISKIHIQLQLYLVSQIEYDRLIQFQLKSYPIIHPKPHLTSQIKNYLKLKSQ